MLWTSTGGTSKFSTATPPPLPQKAGGNSEAARMRELTRQIGRAGQRAGVQRQVHGYRSFEEHFYKFVSIFSCFVVIFVSDKARDIHMTSDGRLLCLQSDWFRQHSGANAQKPPWNARAIQRISDPEAMVFIVAARPLYILSMDITTCATTLE